MLYQIFSLIIEVSVGLLTGACLLRLYMQYQRIPMSQRSGNPLGQFIFALTDWLVLPLRRVIPAVGRWDMASLVAAVVLQLLQYGLLWLFSVSLLSSPIAPVPTLPVLAVFGVVRTALTGLTGLVIIHAVLSWVQTQSQISDLLDRLVAPPLRPIRRVMPLVGGVDLSVLVLLVLLQIFSMLLSWLQSLVLRML